MRSDAWLARFRLANETNGYNKISEFVANDIAFLVDELIDAVLADHACATTSLDDQKPGKVSDK